MCIRTTYIFGNCRAVIEIYRTCYKHIVHTHKQIDNEPCPDRQRIEKNRMSMICDCKVGKNGDDVFCRKLRSVGVYKRYIYSFDKEDSKAKVEANVQHKRGGEERMQLDCDQIDEEKRDQSAPEKRRRMEPKSAGRNEDGEKLDSTEEAANPLNFEEEVEDSMLDTEMS